MVFQPKRAKKACFGVGTARRERVFVISLPCLRRETSPRAGVRLWVVTSEQKVVAEMRTSFPLWPWQLGALVVPTTPSSAPPQAGRAVLRTAALPTRQNGGAGAAPLVSALCFCCREDRQRGVGWWNKQWLIYSVNLNSVWWVAQGGCIAAPAIMLGGRSAAPLRAIITFWVMYTLLLSHSFSPSFFMRLMVKPWKKHNAMPV